MEVGQLCVKIAGRDAGKKCVVVDVLDKNFVLIDGETRRRKCNILHIEPLEQTVDVKKGASHELVAKALESLGITSRNTKQKKVAKRRKHLRKKKAKIASATPKAPVKPKVVEAQAVPKTSAPVNQKPQVKTEKK